MNLGRTVILTIVAVSVAVASLWWTNQAVTPKEATWEDVTAEAQRGGYRLVTTQELASMYSQQQPMMIDTRQDWEYRTGHIKGAVNFPIEPTWWSRWRKADSLQHVLGSDKERLIVFY
jgi:3-mercaptopyruvate sulfurtransferase SseA